MNRLISSLGNLVPLKDLDSTITLYNGRKLLCSILELLELMLIWWTSEGNSPIGVKSFMTRDFSFRTLQCF